MKSILKILCFCTMLYSCETTESTTITSTNTEHLKYFGFTLIDTFWDDPLDAEEKTNYLDEVASFSNIADLLILEPSDNILQRLLFMKANNVKAILHINEIFFENVRTGGPSGKVYDLRSNYQERWDTFLTTNNLSANTSMIEVFYLGEEPTWNSISFTELKLASDHIKSTISNVPIMLIEAYPAVNELEVPNSIDWVGFDHYFIKDPKNNPVFLNELSILKSKLSNDDQKIVFIMDAHYIEEGHGDFGDIDTIEMGNVANSYYELAISESKVIALIGYTWPGGFDTNEALGARQLPRQVQDEYTRIGKEITGK